MVASALPMAAPESGVPSSDSPPGSSAPPIAEPAMPSTSVAIQLTPGKAKAASMRRRHQRVRATSATPRSSTAWMKRDGSSWSSSVTIPACLATPACMRNTRMSPGSARPDAIRIEVAPRGGKQRLRAGHVAPVARIGRHRLRLVAEELAPQPANEAEAIAAHPLHARLMVIGRADPAAGGRNNLLARGHETCACLAGDVVLACLHQAKSE